MCVHDRGRFCFLDKSYSFVRGIVDCGAFNVYYRYGKTIRFIVCLILLLL